MAARTPPASEGDRYQGKRNPGAARASPAPTKSKARTPRLRSGAAEGVVVEAERLHFLGAEQIPAVDDQAAAHHVAGFFPIEIPEDGPLRADQCGVHAFQGFVGIIEIGNIRKEVFFLCNGLRITGVHVRAFFDEAANHFERGGETDVVRIGFERQPENRDALPADHPESFVHFFKEAVDALLVDALGGFQHVELDAYRGGKVDEGLNVLRKAEATEAEAGLEELRADAGIEAHGVGDFLDVGADALAEVGDDIGVTDFQGEERVGSVLDEFGAADRGDQEFAAGAVRALSRVDRAIKFLFEDGPIDFAEGGGALFVLDADDDAVRVKEIGHGGAFAQELGIGCDLEFDAACRGISGKRLLQLDAGQCRNGAFFHHEFGAARFGGDLTGDVVDRGKIGFAGILGRSADADEDDFPGANGFSSVRGVGDLLFPSGPLKDFVEMLLVDRHFTGFQQVNPILVDVRTENIVTCGGEASSSYKSHVATPDYRQSHLRISSSVAGRLN